MGFAYVWVSTHSELNALSLPSFGAQSIAHHVICIDRWNRYHAAYKVCRYSWQLPRISGPGILPGIVDSVSACCNGANGSWQQPADALWTMTYSAA